MTLSTCVKRILPLFACALALSCVAYAEQPPLHIPPPVEIVVPTDPPPVEDGTAPIGPPPVEIVVPTDPPPVEDGTAPTDPPSVEDGAAPIDPPPVEDGTPPVDPPPVEDSTSPIDPEIVTLLQEILNRIDFVLFTLLPVAVAVLVVIAFCWWFEDAFFPRDFFQ